MNAAKSYSLRMTGNQHLRAYQHLYPGDGLEAAVLMLCGLRRGERRVVLAVHEVVEVPHAVCSRSPDRIQWPTSVAVPLLEKAMKRGLVLVKMHSHPGGFASFSQVDDQSDRELFESLKSWMGESAPNGSLVMLLMARFSDACLLMPDFRGCLGFRSPAIGYGFSDWSDPACGSKS